LIIPEITATHPNFLINLLMQAYYRKFKAL
jgi:hypothetical protein